MDTVNINRTRSDAARQHRDLVAETSSLVWWGWGTAVLVQPVGFVIGAILTAKGRTGHGIGQMIVALVLFASLLSQVS